MTDLRFAFRMLVVQRWFSLAILATLAIGIGINTTVFTLVNAVLFKALPVPNGDRVVVIAGRSTTPSGPAANNRFGVSYPDMVDMRSRVTSFDEFEASVAQPAVIAETSRPPERFPMARVTSGFFRLFGAAPVLGRGFRPADEAEGAPVVVVIGHTVWRHRYQSAPDVIGRSVRLNEKPATIVGVMPEGFGFPQNEEVWIPLVPSANGPADRKNRSMLVFGLMKPGATIESATADVSAAAASLAQAYPNDNTHVDARVMTFNERFNGGQIRVVFSLMLAAVALVLLVACANVANMMLSRSVVRQREMTIRSALGASRWRMIRQLLTESLVVSALGGAVGLLMSVAGVRLFDRAVANTGKPSWIVFDVDYSVVLYLGAVCVLAALFFGVAPALRGSRVDLNHSLKEGGRGGSGRIGWLSGALVVLQFTLAVVLLTAAGLMIRSFMAGQTINPWVPGDELLLGRLELPERYPDPAARIRFFDTLHARLRALPGVRHAALSSAPPSFGPGTHAVEIEGAPVVEAADRPTVSRVLVSPGYFRAVNLTLARGRDFIDIDGTSGHESAIVTRAFASRFWPNEDPVGKRIRFPNDANASWVTVVGQTDDVVQSSRNVVPDAVAFLPYRQVGTASLMIVLRAAGDAHAAAQPLRLAVQALDPDLPLFDVRTFDDQMYLDRWPYRVFGVIFSIFAVAALVMAAVGLYGVMSQATSRRTREIGIRMALGATPAGILRAVLGRGAAQLLTGLVLGVSAAFFVSGQMQTLLVGVVPTDPVVFVGTPLVLLAVGLIACWIPAHRAAAIAPMRALTSDDRPV
jgi:predicted permease